jgi:hypothetical protein
MSRLSGSNNVVKKKRSPPKKYEINNKYMNNHFYGVRSRSNMIKSGEMVLGQSYSKHKDKDLKSINDRLRILEKLEIETGLNLQKEKEKAKYQKNLINEEFSKIGSNRQQNINKTEDHNNKMKFLYNERKNDEGDFKNEYGDYKRNNYSRNYYDDIINSNDREYLDTSLSKEKNKSFQKDGTSKDMFSKGNDKDPFKTSNDNQNSNLGSKDKSPKVEKIDNKDKQSKQSDTNDKSKELKDNSKKINEKPGETNTGEGSKVK